MDKHMVIMIGIQASGKSTFFQKHLKENYIHINLDTLKTRNRESQLLEECLKKGVNIAIDNTNPTKADRKKYILAAKDNGYKVTGYFMQSRLRDCITRNSLRQGDKKIPDIAIAATSNKLEIPSHIEGFDQLYFVSISDGDFIISEWRE